MFDDVNHESLVEPRQSDCAACATTSLAVFYLFVDSVLQVAVLFLLSLG